MSPVPEHLNRAIANGEAREYGLVPRWPGDTLEQMEAELRAEIAASGRRVRHLERLKSPWGLPTVYAIA